MSLDTETALLAVSRWPAQWRAPLPSRSGLLPRPKPGFLLLAISEKRGRANLEDRFPVDWCRVECRAEAGGLGLVVRAKQVPLRPAVAWLRQYRCPLPAVTLKRAAWTALRLAD